MFVVQLYSIMKDYFELNGVKEKEAEEDIKTYSEMYDQEYLDKLLSIADSLFIDIESIDFDFMDEDELVECVGNIQYEIEEKIKKELYKLAERGE